MKIRKFHPSPALAPMVMEFMIIETGRAVESHSIPHTSLVLSFRYRGRVEGLAESSVTGIRTTARTFRYEQDTANLLVMFRAGGFASFSRIPAHQLYGLTVSGEDLLPGPWVREMPGRLASARNDHERIRVMEQALLQQFRPDSSDALVTRSLSIIMQSGGLVRIRELAEQLNLSQDPFEKRFRRQVGATPKQFASLVRLRSVIQQYQTTGSLTGAAYAAGYFDQSHFIRDFRRLAGRSPKDFLRGFRFW